MADKKVMIKSYEYKRMVEKMKKMERQLKGMSKLLNDAIASGSKIDKPEGSRYIKITDTLRKEWVKKINEVVDINE